MRNLLYTIALGLTLASCTKNELKCETFDLGAAGELYNPIPTRGEQSVIFVEDGRVKQEICYNE